MPDPPTRAADLLDALLIRGIAEEAKTLPGWNRTVRSRAHGIHVGHVPSGSPKKAATRQLPQFSKKRTAPGDPAPPHRAPGATRNRRIANTPGPS